MCKNDLDKIFNEYYERKKIEEEALKKKKLEEQEKEKLIIDKLKEIVIPVIETISKEIEKKGHKASVLNHLKNFPNPSVVFKFSPVFKEKEDYASLSDSSISFICLNGRISIEKDIYLKETRPDRSSFGVNIDDLTKNWVKTEVIKFITEVLKSK